MTSRLLSQLIARKRVTVVNDTSSRECRSFADYPSRTRKRQRGCSAIGQEYLPEEYLHGTGTDYFPPLMHHRGV